ncbi:L-2-hydroxyglutarate oxidase [Blastopirellula sp. JC732]|uniref:L-2-hydroxyglutarate oxidase n=1 Tax=Blastopirellula sediminis TaxID=2894196 RepID=A0A9X1MGY4_9BACT|nr:L-2-hydroxyglutarate oxidase [Blastopirellula sediminis]MCC9604323.1 L-2-hydroxyglutarate oxidase [Blastopirellula sediminis]MCC9626843.1 L-2-hydroxyglutarate oxidase [Blastopirellula sediminis]
MSYDAIVLGGGIVGLATAYEMLQREPGRRVVVCEKESALATHQTGRNSGVLHSGIYYKPGSLKATNCRAGKALMEEFCREQAIPYDICGKVIVAVDKVELPRLEGIYQRGQANGVLCERIGRERLLELEPYCAGIEAIHVPEAGIVDYRQVSEKLGALIRERGGDIWLNAKVEKIVERESEIAVETTAGSLVGQFAINCCGLYCDRVARLTGAKPEATIVPFRGEYFELRPEAERLCRNLIYPVPDLNFPFLGVHFTRMIHGGVECGPNAVMAMAREGYGKLDVNFGDLWESLSYSGFRSLVWRHWQAGMQEFYRSCSKAAFVRSLQRLVPDIKANDISTAPAGIRAQAIAPNGDLVDDFLIQREGRMINVLNAPSPAATSSLQIAKTIVDSF